MGVMSVNEMVRKIKEIIGETESKWKEGNTIMLDVFMRRERHIYLKSMPGD